MRLKAKMAALAALALIALALGAAIGSVGISPRVLLSVLGSKLFGAALPEDIGEITVSILWTIRFPRAVCAFLIGAALAASGTVMQSVLRNPLASSYTLGVSSGASLFAAAVIVTGFTLPVLERYTLPLFGFLAGWARCSSPWRWRCASTETSKTRRSYWSAWCFRCSSTRC